jgi:hypothetical protein
MHVSIAILSPGEGDQDPKLAPYSAVVQRRDAPTSFRRRWLCAPGAMRKC